MPGSLAEVLPLVTGPVSDALVGPASRARIAQQASRMPQVAAVAIECRLAPGAEQVDIQQCFRRRMGDFPRLAQEALRCEALADDAAVAQFRAFLGQFGQADTVLAPAIDEVFLEYDLPALGAAPALPNLFLSLPQDGRQAQATLHETLTHLGGQPPEAGAAQAIATLFSALDGDAFIDSVGLMVARPAAGLRVNVKGLELDQLPAFLAATGWSGDREQLLAAFADAVDRYDTVTLALDLAPQHAPGPLPHFALECFLADQPPAELRWSIYLAELVSQGLVAEDKARAFVAVPGDIYPPQWPGPWPAALVRETLLRPATHFSSFARRLSHLKLVYGPHGLAQVKGYFGAGHLWRVADEAGTAADLSLTDRPTRRRATVVAQMGPPANPLASLSAQAAACLAKGTAAVLARQLQSGLWRDYLVQGWGEEWISAFLAAETAPHLDDFGRERLNRAFDRLRQRQRPTGGWGYSREYSGDADSTAWVLRLARALGRDDDPRLAAARQFLHDHVGPGGGLGTFRDIAQLAGRMGVAQDRSFAGWQQEHCSVTAAALPFLDEERRTAARANLVAGQQPDGHWQCYWWVHPAYATAMAVDALEHGTCVPLAATRRARDWAVAATLTPTNGASLSLFDRAMLLRLLAGSADATHRRAAARLAADLVAGQGDSGLWPPAARLRVPAMAALGVGQAKEEWFLDARGLFTSGAAIGALGRWRAGLEETAP